MTWAKVKVRARVSKGFEVNRGLWHVRIDGRLSNGSKAMMGAFIEDGMEKIQDQNNKSEKQKSYGKFLKVEKKNKRTDR